MYKKRLDMNFLSKCHLNHIDDVLLPLFVCKFNFFTIDAFLGTP